jgi:hypothetical protein
MHASHSAESVRMTVSVTEASAILGISRSLAYELIAKRELPCSCRKPHPSPSCGEFVLAYEATESA